MIEITSIAAFQRLPVEQQTDICRSLMVKSRLETWLAKLSDKREPVVEGHFKPCKRCEANPGWVWEEATRDDRDVHPSQIHKCAKSLWFACSGYTGQLEEHIDSRLRMIFDLGHAWHATVQGYGKRGAWGNPQNYHPEVPIDPDAVTESGTSKFPIAEEFWIRGHADALVYDVINVPSMGQVLIKLVHEYKTINSGNFSKLRSAKPEHKRQATIYSAVLDAPIVVYLYVNKDNCQLVDYPVPFDNSIWVEITNKISKVQEYVEAGQPPPWEMTSAQLSPAECMDCGYRKLCKPPLKRG